MVSVFPNHAISSKIREFIIPEVKPDMKVKEASVLFNKENGHLKVTGDLTNLFGSKYYNSVINSLDQYFREESQLSVSFSLEYVNLSCAKVLFDLFDRIRKYRAKSAGIEIEWLSAKCDTKMIEIGKYFEESCELKFKFNLY